MYGRDISQTNGIFAQKSKTTMNRKQLKNHNRRLFIKYQKARSKAIKDAGDIGLFIFMSFNHNKEYYTLLKHNFRRNKIITGTLSDVIIIIEKYRKLKSFI